MAAERVSDLPTQGEPGPFQRRVFLWASLLYGAIVAAVLPWVTVPGPQNPLVAVVAAVAVAVSDFLTALLLFHWHKRRSRLSIIVLCGGYLYSGALCLLNMAAIPGTLGLGFASDHMAAGLYLLWRFGAALAYFAAVWLEGAGREWTQGRQVTRPLQVTGAVVLVTSAIVCVLIVLAETWTYRGVQYHGITFQLDWFCNAVLAAALVLIWVNRAFDDPMYLWLSLAIVANIADLTLGNAAGGRYTVGWYAQRTSLVVSAYLLLIFLVTELSQRAPRSTVASFGAYGGAVAATLAAVFMQWSLSMWTGPEAAFIAVFAATGIAVWLGGWRPAVLSSALGYVLVEALLRRTPAAGGALPSAAVGGALYAAASLLIISLGESMRRARDQYREAESRAQERAAALQRADQNKTEFLATLAHELRNPLAPIRSGITLLGLTKDENVLAETRLMMDRQVTQLTRLVDDLVDVSRINRGMLDLRRQPTSMQAVLQSAFDTVQPILKAKRHNVQMNISGEPLYVDGDQARLSQVFSNLLQNAAKFTPVGGHIEVAMGAEGDFAVVSVTDSGVGIDRENLQDIFDLFVQLQPSRTQGGMGLGLAIARSIVQRHGGAIEAFSEGPGHGAKFLVQLPLVGAPVSAPAASEVRRSPSTEEKVHRNALIVDDNLDHASIIAELLRAHGHRVDVAEDGAAALQAAKRLLPDVAFIDLNMDGIDGYEVARRIRAMPLGRDVQLIALTGMGQARDMERTKSAGFDHHLVKPADPDVVLKLAAMARQESIQP